MRQIDAPNKLTLAFAANGGKNSIPTTSNPTPGGASFYDGFPPLTRTPKVAGGIPPSGLDMNGVLYSLSNINKWANAGAGYAYDSAFANDSNVNGYPIGAHLLSSDGLGRWKSTADNNVVDPEGANTNWVPAPEWSQLIVPMSGSNVTLTPLQANKYAIYITGALSANLNLVFPNWAGVEWLVIGGFTGAYYVTCKTAAGAGVKVQVGSFATVYCDGTNILNANQFRNGSYLGLATYGAAATIAPSDVNKAITLTGSGATMTLPSWSSTYNGDRIVMLAHGGNFTIQPGAGDTLYYGATSIASVPLVGTQYIEVTAGASTGVWQITGGSPVAGGVGVWQTWQSLIGSRALGTTYLNGSYKPIQVSVWATSTVNSNIIATVGGVTASAQGCSTGGVVMGISFIVPPNTNYSVSVSAGTPTLQGWSELR